MLVKLESSSECRTGRPNVNKIDLCLVTSLIGGDERRGKELGRRLR